jgi:hypothetical protein
LISIHYPSIQFYGLLIEDARLKRAEGFDSIPARPETSLAWSSGIGPHADGNPQETRASIVNLKEKELSLDSPGIRYSPRQRRFRWMQDIPVRIVVIPPPLRLLSFHGCECVHPAGPSSDGPV